MKEEKDDFTIGYDIIIRKNKARAKCRQCGKIIHPGTLCVFISISGYNAKKMVVHLDCMITKLIKDVKKIKLKALEDENNKWKRVQEALENKG